MVGDARRSGGAAAVVELEGVVVVVEGVVVPLVVEIVFVHVSGVVDIQLPGGGTETTVYVPAGTAKQ